MIDQRTLEALETRVAAVLDGEPSLQLDVLGYGEISTVLRVESGNEEFAAKRLPVMTRHQLGAYRTVLDAYISQLSDRGVAALRSEVHSVGDDPVVPYCVQPLHTRLLVNELTTADTITIATLMDQLAQQVAVAADGTLGIDAQISNWALDGDRLVYFDVTTPLLRTDMGEERTDLDLFIASLPWLLRGTVRRFLLGEILSHYYNPRPALLDAVANLHKERLPQAIEPLLDAANRVVEPAITLAEVNRYYRLDAMMWGLLQRLRRADRWWQRTVRRRRYPFLLPGEIER